MGTVEYPIAIAITNGTKNYTAVYAITNQDETAAIFCYQVAAWVSDMFCNFNLVKSYKIANNSATTEAREKMNTDLESVEF